MLDAFSRRVVGWSIGSTPATSLVTNALGMAIGQRRPTDQTVIHSDQGTQGGFKGSTQRPRELTKVRAHPGGRRCRNGCQRSWSARSGDPPPGGTAGARSAGGSGAPSTPWATRFCASLARSRRRTGTRRRRARRWASARSSAPASSALGAAANLAAIAANGGVMPASPRALESAGLAASHEEYKNSAALERPRLAFLGDVFALPTPWPLHNVFSAGDVLVVAGAGVAVHRLCGSRLGWRRRGGTGDGAGR